MPNAEQLNILYSLLMLIIYNIGITLVYCYLIFIILKTTAENI